MRNLRFWADNQPVSSHHRAPGCEPVPHLFRACVLRTTPVRIHRAFCIISVWLLVWVYEASRGDTPGPSQWTVHTHETGTWADFWLSVSGLPRHRWLRRGSRWGIFSADEFEDATADTGLPWFRWVSVKATFLPYTSSELCLVLAFKTSNIILFLQLI